MGVRQQDIDRAIAAGNKVLAKLREVCPVPKGFPKNMNECVMSNDKVTHLLPKEKYLHEQIAEHCREKGYYFIHARMDRRSTIARGCPDFCIAGNNGKVIWLECKRKGGKLTPIQQATIAHLKKLGQLAFVVDNYSDAEHLIWTWVA